MVKQPNPKIYLIVSLIKSGIRISACVLGIIFSSVIVLGLLLILAEVLGILEELK